MGTLDRLLSLHDLAEITGLTEEALRRMVRDGRGPSFYRVGRQFRFNRADIDAWLAANANAQRPTSAQAA